MPLTIVMPSHKRHENVLTKKILPQAIICVAESEKKLYKKFNPESEIVTHPDSIIGLIPKRNWMLKKFGDMFMVDDDLTDFTITSRNIDENPKRSLKFINNRIVDLYEMAKLMDVKLFGFTKNPRPNQFNAHEPLRLDYTITGCAYGIMGDSELYWNEELKLKEDYWISCLCKHKYRKILVDTRYSFMQKGTFTSPGGLSAIRNLDQEKRDVLKMRKYFGETVVMKNDTVAARNKMENNISIRFRF